MKKIKIILFLAVLFSSFSYAAHVYTVKIPNAGQDLIIQALASSSFNNLKYEDIKASGTTITLNKISFDDNDFSTANKIEIEINPISLLIGKNALKTLTIDGINLTGELTKQNSLQISGINSLNSVLKKAHQSNFNQIYIKNSKINLWTDQLGGILLKIDANIKRTPSALSIQAQLESRQHNLTLSGQITGEITPDQRVQLALNTDQFAFIYDNIKVKRSVLTSNVTYNFSTSSINNQNKITASSATWSNIPLKDAIINIDTSNNTLSIKGNGSTSGFGSIPWTVENINDTHIKVVVKPNKMEEFIDFWQNQTKIHFKPKASQKTLSTELPLLTFEWPIDLPNKTMGIPLTITLRESPLTKMHTVLSNDFIHKDSHTATTEYTLTASSETQDGQALVELEYKQKDLVSKDKSNLITWQNKNFIEEIKLKVRKLDTSINSKTVSKVLINERFKKQFFIFSLPIAAKNKAIISMDLSHPITPEIASFELDLFNGKIKTSRPMTKSGAFILNNEISLSDINLSLLLSYIASKTDIDINGDMGGIIPIKLTADALMANGAVLQSQGNGVIKMSDTMINELFPDQSKQDFLIKESLKNYHYEYFEIRLDGDLTGRIMVTLTSKGYNPDIKDKPIVDVNLQVETDISKILSPLISP